LSSTLTTTPGDLALQLVELFESQSTSSALSLLFGWRKMDML
jgi:hypothetical protein